MTEFETDEAPATTEQMSEARAARKEAQRLTEELGNLIQGRSGLDAEGKKEALSTALNKAKEVVDALERAVTAVS